MTDGARNSLLGYLYQFSIVASLRAYKTGEQEAGPGWPAFLGRISRGTITSELFNQDAIGTTLGGEPKECVAIQIKHSANKEETIDLETFVELLYGFDRSRELASTDGWSTERYYVITNRSVDTKVEQIWHGRSGAELRRAILSRRKKNEFPDWLKKLRKAYSDEATAIGAWLAILDRLEPPLVASHDTGIRRLKSFARQHGVLPAEVEKSLSTLVGQLFQDTAASGAVDITSEWLKRGLVGAPDAREATFGAQEGIVSAAREQLSKRITEVAGPSHAALTRRRQK